MCVQSSSRVLPSLTTWNCMKAKAVTMIRAKPYKQIRHLTFANLRKDFTTNLFWSIVKIKVFFRSLLLKSISFFEFAGHAPETGMLDHTLGGYMIAIFSALQGDTSSS